MKKSRHITALVIRILCVLILVWTIAYFLFADRISIRFVNREFVPVFTKILVFGSAAAIYCLFILSIRSNRKKWINVLLFVIGLFIGSLVLSTYHALLQYKCGFWNQVEISNQTIYLNAENEAESVKKISTQCELKDEEKTETIYVKNLNSWFEIVGEPEIILSEHGKWIRSE